MPANVAPQADGLHGAVWFETVYQDKKIKAEKRCMRCIIMNIHKPFRTMREVGKGYIDKDWPPGFNRRKNAGSSLQNWNYEISRWRKKLEQQRHLYRRQPTANDLETA